ncbi:GntR family transcriptional regulator [Amycolatopsis endophytica]|uniref:DNA-binding GntR family transcriptional regulator n=1 Tax=Amycolatopsis endophytica TaxID=860233 RepID=A0A853B1C5_9PSEU|nr:GntR family transcriptional regulator [Amycolatopsis endophytica]NYI88893.1 DNA-binding GntR family transcriptional regulator [Amycolatopsis endophytica]
MTEPAASPLSSLDRPESLAERAYQRIRETIASGGLAPGQKITERNLALLLGVSPTPVREALRRLEQEHLVERLSTRALVVARHSSETVRELLYAESLLRGALARFATMKITDEEIDQLAEIVDELGSDEVRDDIEVAQQTADRFDAVLRRAAGNDSLSSLASSAGVFGRARRVRLIGQWSPEERVARLRIHREIVDALRARDADRVERLTREQVDSSRRLLLNTDLD